MEKGRIQDAREGFLVRMLLLVEEKLWAEGLRGPHPCCAFRPWGTTTKRNTDRKSTRDTDTGGG